MNPLSASPGEGEPARPPPSVPASRPPGRQPGCPCSVWSGAAGGNPAAAPVGTDRPSGQRALRDRDSPGEARQGLRCRPRAGATKSTCCGSGAPAPHLPATPTAQEGSSPRDSSDPDSPRSSSARTCPDTQACAVPYGTAVRRDGAAAALPLLAPITHRARRRQLALLRGARRGFKRPPPGFTYPARTVSVFLGRAHLCR